MACTGEMFEWLVWIGSFAFSTTALAPPRRIDRLRAPADA
jgi:hypothetical protein